MPRTGTESTKLIILRGNSASGKSATAAEMSAWYRERDLLPGGIEQIIPAASSLDETVRQVMSDTGFYP